MPCVDVLIPVINKIFLLPSSRAKDARAKAYILNEKRKVGWPIDGLWSNGKNITDLASGMIGDDLSLFKFGTVSHTIFQTEIDEQTITHSFTVSGNCTLILALDADGIEAKEIDLGTFDFPEYFLPTKEMREEWRRDIGKSGYAVFLEQTIDGKLLARIMGNIPSERMDQLKKELVSYTIERI